MEHWIISGVGICADELRPFIDYEKLTSFLKEEYEIDDGNLTLTEKTGLDGLMHGCPYDNFAELLTHCDETDLLTYDDTGNGECSYLFYPPTMPWNRRENEPTSPEEVHELIAVAVSKICNIPREKLEELINDELYVEGCC